MRIVATALAAATAAAGLAATAGAQDRYTDVNSTHHPEHKANIEALESLGVFDGTECGARKFCPAEPAQRWTVAVWIVRVIDGEDPYPVTKSRFADVDDDEWWMPYVERLADLGITVGCRQDPLRYCPDRGSDRGAVASQGPGPGGATSGLMAGSTIESRGSCLLPGTGSTSSHLSRPATSGPGSASSTGRCD